MAVDMMAPLKPWLNLSMVDKEYYSFYVNVCDDSAFNETKKRLIVPSEQSFTQENLRQRLYDKFGIRKDSRISYIDDDGDDLPIESECEFQEALKLARTFTPNKGLILVVRPWKLDGWRNIPDMEQSDKTSKEQDARDTAMMTQSCTSDLNGTTRAMTDMISKMGEKQPEVVVPSDTWFQVDDLNVLTRWHSHEDTSPPPWFTEYMESMKKEMVSTITQEVVKQMTEMLNKRLDSTLASSLSNEASQSKSRRSQSSLSKRHPRCSFDSHSNERSQKRMNAQDEGQFSDASIERVDEPQDVNVNANAAKDHDRQLQQAKLYLHDLDNIKGQIHELLKEKQYYRVDEMTNNLDMGINNKQERKESVENVQNDNMREDVAPPICCMTSDALKILDGELRMNCSITGNRALNVDSFHENTWCDDLMEDIDKISHCSGCSIAADEREHVDTFVMVEMPTPENADSSLTHPNAPSVAELRQRDNSRDSPSFELLSETPSPRSSPYIDEDHFVNVFSTNEADLQTPVDNSSASSAYMVDIHGKIHNEHSPTTPDMNVEFEKRSDGVYSFVAETLPVREIDSSKSSHVEQQTFSEQKSSRCNAQTSSNDDKRNQLPIYSRATDDQHQSSAETDRIYRRPHSRSQIDASDFVQSFHSHTTSVTDNNNDLFYHRSYAEQTTVTKNAQKATTTTSPRKATRHNTRDKRSSRTRADETRRDDSDKFFRPQQSSRTSAPDGCSNGSRRTFNEQMPYAAVDPVLILPETLLTMAAQVGSIAYVTARDMFDKLRSHTKEDPVKRRRSKSNAATADGCSPSSTTRRPANQS